MSFGLFCCVVLASTVLLVLIFIHRERLIDFEDRLFYKLKALFKGVKDNA